MPVAICLFIDGLDEFEGQYEAVVKTIQSISSQANVKVCLSSRTLNTFVAAFHDKPGLRLQDLTFESIRAYAQRRLLEPVWQRFADREDERQRAYHLVNRLVNQADGVFLWAVIATRDLRCGLQDFATWSELQAAVDNLPTGIENLYTNILSRIKSTYREEAIRLLLLILCESELNGDTPCYLVTLTFMDQERVFKDAELSQDPIAKNDMAKACLALRSRLLSHTLGLIDFSPALISRKDEDDHLDEDDLMLSLSVVFHHRSAKEFLLQNVNQGLLKSSLHSEEINICYSVARGHFAFLRHSVHLLPAGISRSRRDTIRSALSVAFECVSIVERLSGSAQINLIRTVPIIAILDKCEERDTANLYVSNALGLFPDYKLLEDEAREIGGVMDFAAYHGMLQFVCKVLDLAPIDILPTRDIIQTQLDRSRSPLAHPIILLDPSLRREVRISTFRSDLSKYAKWKVKDPETSSNQASIRHGGLAETFVLSGIEALRLNRYYFVTRHGSFLESQRLISLLLQAGADPMARVYRFENQTRQDTSAPADIAEALPISRQMQIDKVGATAPSAVGKLSRGGRGEVFVEPDIEEMGSKTNWEQNDRSSGDLGEERRRNVNGDEEIKERQNMEEGRQQYNAEKQEEETEGHNEKEEEEEHKIISLSFWEQWLGFLSYFCLWAKTEGSFVYKQSPRFPSAANNYADMVARLWHTTKLLLLNGADVNLRVRSLWPISNMSHYHYCPLRKVSAPVFGRERWRLVVDCAAVYWLDACFDDVPEFRDFLEAIQTSSSRSRRKLLGIVLTREDELPSKADHFASLNEQDQDILWPLIEQYEGCSSEGNIEREYQRSLLTAMVQIWARQYPQKYAQLPNDRKKIMFADDEVSHGESLDSEDGEMSTDNEISDTEDYRK